MAYEEALKCISVPASGDLSSDQFKIVDLSTAAQAAVGNRDGIGVLQNKPSAAGRAASVAVGGVSKVSVTGAIAAGDPIKPSTVGLGIVSSTLSVPIIGRALEANASGAAIISVKLDLE